VASEEGAVEKPALALLEELGWTPINLMAEQPGPANPTGRTSFHQPHLPARLRAALVKLNPDLPISAIDAAEARLTQDRSALSPVHANREVIALVVDGVQVQVKNEDGGYDDHRVRVIDWKNARNNDFVIANQVWVHGLLHKRRPDTIGYVNGLPLLLAEWKAPTAAAQRL
jgi:type I restriction enzyme R subunit